MKHSSEANKYHGERFGLGTPSCVDLGACEFCMKHYSETNKQNGEDFGLGTHAWIRVVLDYPCMSAV